MHWIWCIDVCKQDTGNPSKFSAKKYFEKMQTLKRQNKNPISDNLGYFLATTKLCCFLVAVATVCGLHADCSIW